ncbi:MAG: hypothetical protein ACI85I_000568 [Arenicella sp.]|jgi:hypothetical protein
MLKKILLSVFLLIGFIGFVHGQSQILGQDTTRRPIITAVPFLTIAPDARAAGMGDAGGALSADANATYWNAAKLAFIETNVGGSLSFTPWLAKLVDDMYVFYGSGYKKLSDTEAIGASLRYFDLGDITFTDSQGNVDSEGKPKEFSLDLSYSRILSKTSTKGFGMGVTGRFIHSNLTSGLVSTTAKPGNTAAVDLGAFYENKGLLVGGLASTLRMGAQISNVGIKISYSDANSKDFLPTNLRLSSALTTEIDGFNKFTVSLDVNKLMVPSPDENNQSPDKTLIPGMFGSFSDAPDGFSEELQELVIAVGAEYWYNDIFAIRAGYFNEHELKGARKYFTAGVGFKYTKFAFDFAYLIAAKQNNPLENTLRFTLMVNVDSLKEGE